MLTTAARRQDVGRLLRQLRRHLQKLQARPLPQANCCQRRNISESVHARVWAAAVVDRKRAFVQWGLLRILRTMMVDHHDRSECYQRAGQGRAGRKKGGTGQVKAGHDR